MTCGDLKNLPKTTAFGKALCDKAFNIAKNPKYDSYQQALASIVYKCIDERSSGTAVKSEII